MEEYNISDISSSSVRVPAQKKRRLKTKYIVIGVITLIVLYFITNSFWWKRYNEKYYEHFIEKNNIESSSLDERSSWGYVPYKYKGKTITLEYHKPGKNQYTFGVGLCCNLNNFDTIFWEVPFDDNRYEYELCNNVDKFGKVTYSVFLDTYSGDSDISYEQIGFDINERGEFDYNGDGHPELTDEQRKVAEYLKDDILAVRNEIEKLM